MKSLSLMITLTLLGYLALTQLPLASALGGRCEEALLTGHIDGKPTEIRAIVCRDKFNHYRIE